MPGSSITEMLRQHVEMMEKAGFARERNLMAVILDHGKPYELDREASASAQKGALKECFANAGKAALFEEGLTYVEGFALSSIGLPVHHAWVLNGEGKVVEVTWRDGGNECGFCVEGERELDEDEEGYDEEDEETWTEVCRFCGGTGESKHTHPTLEDAEYYGIEVDADVLRRIVVESGTWGAIETKGDLKKILGKEEK